MSTLKPFHKMKWELLEMQKVHETTKVELNKILSRKNESKAALHRKWTDHKRDTERTELIALLEESASSIAGKATEVTELETALLTAYEACQVLERSKTTPSDDAPQEEY